GSFDTADFEHTVDIVLLAQEIVVGPSSYPTEEIGNNARAFRQLGLGYANLGAFLMSNGMPYDSDEGRAAAAAITALMTGRGYRKSAEIAAAIGPYEEYGKNREAHNGVMRMHRDAAYELVGGGQMTIVNRSVPLALDTLGYTAEAIEQISAFINEKGTIVGAPGLEDGHLPVFDVAVGERAISHMGHIQMMSATQPFLSGAISKTVNLPETATVADIADAYTRGWKGGLKALAIYRDGSKTAQALRTESGEKASEDAETAAAEPVRHKMPIERESITHKFNVAGHE